MQRIYRPLTATMLIVILMLLFSSAASGRELDPFTQPDPASIATLTWAVKVAPGASADQIAAQTGMINLGSVAALPGYYRFEAQPGLQRDTSISDMQRALDSNTAVLMAEQQVIEPRFTRDTAPAPVNIYDPMYPEQWHLRNTGQGGGIPGEDARIVPAWNLGYSRRGVVVASVDDGMYLNSPDLLTNIRPDLSYDYVGNDSDPSAGSHGTSVAGVMAASANDNCGVGVAYGAQVAGVRLLGSNTDINEALSLTHHMDSISIYNNSWGPGDNGRVLQGPRELTRAALVAGVREGRGGLGAVYVWAAGNGGARDNVNADGYANSPYTIAVGATTNNGGRAYYSEPGAPILVNAPSSGGTRGITTTDGPGGAGYTGGDCYTQFGGTSSASPLVAGVIALMLEANPTLTWRDVQHILLRSAVKNDSTHPDWTINAAGFNVNHTYGFGRVNAKRAVKLAQNWVNVPERVTLTSNIQVVNSPIPDAPNESTPGATINSSIYVGPDANISLEHIEIVFDATHTWRGDIEITLTSPSGTISRMMYGRGGDSNDHYQNWRMMSVRHWGEQAAGVWTLSVHDTYAQETGTWNHWQLIIHGHSTAYRQGLAIEAGQQMLANSGFEESSSDPRQAEFWTGIETARRDRVVNNISKSEAREERIVAYSGDRAFRIKGEPGKNTRLRQVITNKALISGDTLYLSSMVRANALEAGASLRLVAVYDDGSRDKLRIHIAPGTYDYTLQGQSMTLRGPVKKLIVVLQFNTSDHTRFTGTVLVDQVQLTVESLTPYRLNPAGDLGAMTITEILAQGSGSVLPPAPAPAPDTDVLPLPGAPQQPLDLADSQG